MKKTNVNRRTFNDVIVTELEQLQEKISARLLSLGDAVKQLELIGRHDLASPVRAEVSACVWVRSEIDGRIKSLNEGEIV